MRILFLAPYIPSLIRVRPYHFVRELARRHEVSVLVSGSPGDRADIEALRQMCVSVDVVPLQLSRQLASCAQAAVHGEPLQGAACQSPELAQRLWSLLDRQQFDVVHIEHLRAAHLMHNLPSAQPMVFDAVDCISLLQQRTLHSSHSRLQRWLARLELQRTRAYEAKLLSRSPATIVSAPEDAAALQELAPDCQVRVIANGVDLDYFQPLAVASEPATIVFSGRMAYHANVSAALYFVHQVLPLVKATHPDVRCRIVGSHPPARLRALSSDPSIEVTGHVADIRQTLGRATLSVCPVTVKVGIQNKILEAMAMGVPVVTTPAGARGLLAEDGQELLIGNGPAELAQHIGCLLTNTRRRAELAQRGRAYVERHHRWSSAAQQLDAVYSSVIDLASNRRDPWLRQGDALDAATQRFVEQNRQPEQRHRDDCLPDDCHVGSNQDRSLADVHAVPDSDEEHDQQRDREPDLQGLAGARREPLVAGQPDDAPRQGHRDEYPRLHE
jgi:sugar transferase (PEP-CTERM/EpsH1 system associated)